jgi:hypothetical protein
MRGAWRAASDPLGGRWCVEADRGVARVPFAVGDDGSMVTDPLAAFRSSDDSSAAQLECDPGAGDYRRRKGFRLAAVRLLEEAAAADRWNDRDPLVWPALYSFRHYVELELKYLIREFPQLGLGVPPTTHRLRQLWPSVAEGFARCFGNEDREPFDVLERAIAMFDALDPAGDGFRYATTRRGKPSMIKDVYLDPQALLRLIREVDEVLGAASMAFQATAEAFQEMLECGYDS